MQEWKFDVKIHYMFTIHVFRTIEVEVILSAVGLAVHLSTQGKAVVFRTMFSARTANSHSIKTNGTAATITIDTYHLYSFIENWMTNTVLYGMDNFIDIFRVNFEEEKRPNYSPPYLRFYSM